MKHTLFLFIVCLCCAACSSIMPYKDQNLDYLYSIQKDPAAYKGAVVAFNGEVAGIRETPKSIRLVLRIDTPLYYYATGKGNSLSYEMLYVLFTKNKSQASKIAKGNKLKVLGRVDGYITRQDGYGNTAGVVRLRAIALADRSQDKDFYLSDAPSAALYTSWKKGKLFFEESAEDVLSRVPAPKMPQLPPAKPKPKASPAPKPTAAQPAKPQPPAGIVFDPEEPPFILFPPKEQPDTAPATQAPAQTDAKTSPESDAPAPLQTGEIPLEANPPLATRNTIPSAPLPPAKEPQQAPSAPQQQEASQVQQTPAVPAANQSVQVPGAEIIPAAQNPNTPIQNNPAAQ